MRRRSDRCERAVGLGLFDPQTKSADVQRWLRDEAVAHANREGTMMITTM